MLGVVKSEIGEIEEELNALLRKEKDATRHEKLQVLYGLKTRSVESRYKTLHLAVQASHKRLWQQIVAPMHNRAATAQF